MHNSTNQSVPVPSNGQRKCQLKARLVSEESAPPKAKRCLQNIFENRGVQKSMALILGGFLDCMKNLIQDCFKQIHVLFEGGFPTKLFGVFWTTLSKVMKKQP